MGSTVLTIFIVLTISAAGAERADILIADFESSTYGDWQVTGEAFGPGPAQGTLRGQMEVSGFLGKRLVNTYFEGDDTTGTLTSPPFKVERRYMNFLIGGGMHAGKACINLVVDGKVVRTATGPNDRPGGSERLAWSNWDLRDLAGKTATIEIVDRQTGGWGHINIDHIVQSDRKIEPVDLTRKIKLDKRYLNLPVRTGAHKHYMDLVIDGEIVRQFDIEFDPGEPEFWVFLDVGPFRGKTGVLRLHDSFGLDPKLLESISLDEKIRGAENFYREKNRQQFHFSSRRGWNNDSNGMVFLNGEYHLFYQHNPYGWGWGNMTWGHAVSTDLVHWTELPDAIHPDDLGTIFSGSAAIDEKNTAGFQTGAEKPLVCFYTSAGGHNRMSKGQPFTQSIAYSNDRGRSFTKYEKNPVVGHINGSNRDPKVIWHAPTSRWVMVLYLDGGEMGILVSKDLKSWEMTSKLKCFHECPELFELPVDGEAAKSKWVLYGGSGDYLLGAFDGREFKPETDAIKFHYGNCFYASQTFNNIPAEDGRRIQIAWGRIATPRMPFNQCMLFPVELSLRMTDDGVRMFAVPVEEVKNLHETAHTWTSGLIRPEENLLAGLAGELFHIRVEFVVNPAARFGLTIRGTEVLYEPQKKRLSCRGKSAPLAPIDGKIRLEILVDRNSIEIFANDGRIYMPIGGILPEGNKSLEVFSRGGNTSLNGLKVHTLRSIWLQAPVG